MKKILIVDDSAFMRNILKDLLNNSTDDFSDDIEIYEADGKRNALKQFKKIKPDIILLDVVMQESETEGLEFLIEIKDMFNLNKIVMISSVGQASLIDECKKLGIINYLQKPFDPPQIVETVNRAFIL